MAHSIKTVYVVHHSHTDIGYTDLQERVIAIQVNYIKTVLSMMRQPEYADFRWNCETLYCVEEFWKQASEDDRADFARFVKEGKIGISANYLNFNDLVNADVFGKRLAKWQDKLQPFGTKIHTAMAADVNGFSMGYRDAMIESGVEFFFTNVHCHHGMYPLYQNQNLMLYAEHTWGHSSTITNPYDTMVLNLDMRKNSYASKAHEAASLMLCSIAEKKGDMLRYYNTTGAVRAVGVSHTSQPQLIEFYIETLALEDVEVRDLAGNLYTCQVSPHPRGRKISFIDTLSYGEEKEYIYTARHKAPETLNTRHCYMGAEEVRDIVNDYDPVTYRLPYEVENKFFRICYKPGDGITSFVDKRTGTEMAGTAIPFFTPVYQRTPLHQEVPFSSYEERRALGRNIRGKHAETHIGKLMEITCMEHGPVFTQLRLHYSLAGTVKADVLLKLYEAIPRIDFTLELGKTISDEVESVFLSLDLNRPGNGTVLRKGAREAFRPGIDQLPGTCMEFYMSDDGAARLSPEGGVLIAARDVPMFYTGEMQHHPIRLCDGAAENNARPLYSWVMNNNWETNFKMDLSGFCQYDYSLWLTDISDPEQAMDELHEQLFDPYVLIVR